MLARVHDPLTMALLPHRVDTATDVQYSLLHAKAEARAKRCGGAMELGAWDWECGGQLGAWAWRRGGAIGLGAWDRGCG